MEQPIVFRKYSPEKKEGYLCPNFFEGIIEFKADGHINFRKGAYLTTNKFNTNGTNKTAVEEAKEYLSILYTPKFLYVWNEEACEEIMANAMIQLKNVYGKKNAASRVWSAFGKHGGGCEIVLTEGALIFPEGKELQIEEGEDEFRHDSTMSDLFFSTWLAQTMYEFIRDYKKPFEDNFVKTAIGKILDRLGTVIKWDGKKRFSISCAYKEVNNTKTILKFWGGVWEDDDRENLRLLKKEEYGPDAFDCPKTRIPIYYRERIKKIIEDICEKMFDFASRWSEIEKEKISLPEPECFECISGMELYWKYND